MDFIRNIYLEDASVVGEERFVRADELKMVRETWAKHGLLSEKQVDVLLHQ